MIIINPDIILVDDNLSKNKKLTTKTENIDPKPNQKFTHIQKNYRKNRKHYNHFEPRKKLKIFEAEKNGHL